MTFTSFYGLRKPDSNDYYDVDDFNYNADSIDYLLHGKSDKISYQEGEVNTGNTWIDGEPIYRYIFIGVSERSGSQGTYGQIPDGEPETVISLKGMFQRPTGNEWFTIPTCYYGDIDWNVNLRTDGTGKIMVGFGDQYPKTAKPMILIAEYTKKKTETT